MQANTDKINHIANVMPQLHSNARVNWNRACRVLAAFLIALLFAQSASASMLDPDPSAHLSGPFISELAAVAGAPTSDVFVAPTGQTVQGGFLQTFQKYGLSLIGYPLTPEINEGGRTVQYFERVRMEFHPELAAKGAPVLLSRLGAEVSAGSSFGTVKPFSATSVKSYFGATSHSVAEPFLSFWRNNGGVELFGYPISEAIRQDGMRVQWFERARMEYHPELASKGQSVELTLLGTIAYTHAHGSPLRSLQVNPAPSAPPPLNGMESSLLAGINAQRSAAGVPSVSLTPDLVDFARWRSNDMASRNYFSHTTPEGKVSLDLLRGRGVSYSLAGEILAKNNYPDTQAAGVADSTFMESPTHRAIMLDGRYTQVGVGYAVGGDGMRYFTAVFIRK
jgi:uncharacterized protein YkwD